ERLRVVVGDLRVRRVDLSLQARGLGLLRPHETEVGGGTEDEHAHDDERDLRRERQPLLRRPHEAAPGDETSARIVNWTICCSPRFASELVWWWTLWWLGETARRGGRRARLS